MCSDTAHNKSVVVAPPAAGEIDIPNGENN